MAESNAPGSTVSMDSCRTIRGAQYEGGSQPKTSMKKTEDQRSRGRVAGLIGPVLHQTGSRNPVSAAKKHSSRSRS